MARGLGDQRGDGGAVRRTEARDRPVGHLDQQQVGAADEHPVGGQLALPPLAVEAEPQPVGDRDRGHHRRAGHRPDRRDPPGRQLRGTGAEQAHQRTPALASSDSRRGARVSTYVLVRWEPWR